MGYGHPVSISPDRKIVVFGRQENTYEKRTTLEIWDLQAGQLRHSLEGHQDRIISLLFSHDGNTIISRSADSIVKLWNPITGELILSFEVHDGNPGEEVAVSPDGKTIICSRKSILELHDFQTGELLRTLEEEPVRVVYQTTSITISPNNNLVISSASTYIKIWDLQTGKFLRYLGKAKNNNGTVTISADGKTALDSWSSDNSIQLWDLTGGQMQQRLVGHTNSILAIAISPDGTTALSGSMDTNIRYWDLRNGKSFGVLAGHTSSVNAIAFSPDGKTALSGSGDKTLKYWSLETGQLIGSFEANSPVYNVTISPDGKTALSGSADKTLKYWDLRTGKLIRSMEGHADYIAGIVYCNRGENALTGSGDKSVKLWNLQNGHLLHSFEGHTGPTNLVYATPDGNTVISGSWDGTFKIWDLQTYALLHSITARMVANSMAISATGDTILGGSFSSDEIAEWNIDTGERINTCSLRSTALKKAQHALDGHRGRVLAMSASPDNKTVLTTGVDSTLKLWDLQSGELIHSLKGDTYAVNSITLSPRGDRVVGSGMTRCISFLWDLQTRRLLHTLEDMERIVCPIAMSQDGKTFFSTAPGNTIRRYDLNVNWQILSTFEGHVNLINSLVLSPDERIIISGSDDKTIKIWDIETGTILRSLEGHSAPVNSTAISPDGKIIISGSDDTTIKIWDIETGTILRSLEGHSAPVNSTAISPDGKIIISGSDDTTIKIWDIETGTILRSLEGHSAPVNSTAISPDGKTIVSGSDDTTIKIWDIERPFEKSYVRPAKRSFRVMSKMWGAIESPQNPKTPFQTASETGAIVCSLEDHSGPVNAIALSPDGKTFISGSDDKTVKLWDIQTGRLLRNFTGSSQALSSTAFTIGGEAIICGSDAFNLFTWEIQTGQQKPGWSSVGISLNTTAVFSPDGDFFVTHAGDNSLNLWDAETGALLRSFEGHTNWVDDWVFSLDGKRVISTSRDKTIKYWDVQTGELVNTIQGDGENRLICSPNGKTIIGVLGVSRTTIRDLETGQVLQSYTGEPVVSPNGKLFITHTLGGTLVDLETRGESAFQGEEFKPLFVTDNLAAIGYHEGFIKIWDLRVGEVHTMFASNANISLCWLICTSVRKSAPLWPISAKLLPP